MHANGELITMLYNAFGERDHQTMAACYHPTATFSDPVFTHLEGEEIAAMWRMLVTRGVDLEITFDGVEADDTRGKAHWEARYTFTATGRKVHNKIDAVFTFDDGQIIGHVDHFDLYRWSRMAIGPLGWLLGWTPLLRRRIRRQARQQLHRFMLREANLAREEPGDAPRATPKA